LLESLSHFRDKRALLARLRPLVRRLVMRVNCQDAAPASQAFGGSMHVVSSGELRRIVEDAGYRITHWRDPTEGGFAVGARVEAADRAAWDQGDRQLEVLARWCERVARGLDVWGVAIR